MKKVYSFASGNIWGWTKTKNRNILIDYIREAGLDIDGVEITFASKEELYATRLSKKNSSWLRRLNYATIHAPFKLVRKAKDEQEVIKQLDIISRLYKEVGAKNVIIHPPDLLLLAPEILGRYSFNVSTENLPPRVKISILDLRKILNKYPKMGLCLDVAHAYFWSKHETEKLVKNFKNKISQIHLSGTYKKKDHQSLQVVTDNFLSSVEPIKKLGVPIVIEEAMDTRNLKYVRAEIEYIKKYFQSLQ